MGWGNGLAKKRDILDDFIDIQHDWNAVSHPFDGMTKSITDSLTGKAQPRKIFNAQDYKEKPRANSLYCANCSSRKEGVCTRCADVCPTDSITISGASVKVDDSCRKCGLCMSVCPTEVFQTSNQAKSLYDRIARVAGTYEECYITCTRALKRLPKENEILLPCVGLISDDLWFSLLADYGNLTVYLPLGICDRCRTTTGERTYSDAISQAEEWTGESVGLEVDPNNLNHEQARAYKRSQFMSNMAQAGTQMLTRGRSPLAGAQAVAQRVQRHSKQLMELQKSLEAATGSKTTNNRRRILLQRRKLVMGALQTYPALAKGMQIQVPVCDQARCTMCGECVKACPVHACDLDDQGVFSVEPAYCVGCNACIAACEDGALSMETRDASELVVVDEERERRLAEERKKAEELKAKGKRTLERGLDMIESLDNEDEDKSKKN